MNIISGLLCLLAWGLIIVVPLYVSYSFSRSNLRQRFCDDARRLNGTIIKQSSEWIEARVPGTIRPVDIAFFTGRTHWFGKDTLEIHFPLPPGNGYEFFICCQCVHSKQTPSRWVKKHLQVGSWRAIVAGPNLAALESGLALGLESFFGQFRQAMAPKNCRIAAEGDIIKFFVRQYSPNISDFTAIISLGNKLSQQIGMLVDGTIQMSETVAGSEEQICPICSCDVVNPRNCTRCKTPHCTECWSYNNYSCGVFSCGGSME